MSVQLQSTDVFLTVREVAERLKVNEETVRRLFANEPGVIVICFPRRGRRVYRTLRIPEAVFRRVVERFVR
jgi:excisionase family DNA binding protein